MNKILTLSSLMMSLLVGCFSIDAMECLQEQPNFIKDYLDKGSLPELPNEIGNRIAQYVMENNPIVPWLVQQMTMAHKTLEGHSDWVTSAAFDKTGTKAVTASRDNTAKIWDARTCELIHTFKGHRDVVWSAAFDKTGTKIVTTSYDCTAKIWDAESGALIHTLQGHGGTVYSAAFDGTGTKIVTASRDFTAKIWDAQTSELIHTLQGHGDDGVLSAAFDGTGTKVVIASRDFTAKIWDIGILYYLEQRPSLKQGLLLSYIYAAERLVAKKGFYFDLSKYPHLQNVYESFSEAIRSVLDQYVFVQEKQNEVTC